MRLILAALSSLALTACMGSGQAVETVYETVHVPIRAPCPDDDTFNAVMAAKPTPLRQQPRPETEEAIRQAERAQLGRYEAPGGFADQATLVIKDCHDRTPPLDPPP